MVRENWGLTCSSCCWNFVEGISFFCCCCHVFWGVRFFRRKYVFTGLFWCFFVFFCKLEIFLILGGTTIYSSFSFVTWGFEAVQLNFVLCNICNRVFCKGAALHMAHMYTTTFLLLHFCGCLNYACPSTSRHSLLCGNSFITTERVSAENV